MSEEKPLKRPGEQVNVDLRQQAFVDAYCADPEMNGARAAAAAGYGGKTGAAVAASRLLALPEVQEKIRATLAKRSERTHMTQDEVLQELRELVDADVTDAYDEDWKAKPFLKIPRPVRKLISEIKMTEFGPQLKFEDRNPLRQLLAKHMGIGITSKLQHEGKDGEPLQVVVQVLPKDE